MKKFLLAAFIALPIPAQAHDGQLIGQTIGQLIDIFAHRHHHNCCVGAPYPPPAEYPGVPDDVPPDYEPPVNGPPTNAGPEILQWLDHQGFHNAFIVGRRDQDCVHQSQSFLGGWGVIIRRGNNDRPTSGVVCIDGGNMNMTLDR